MRFQVREFLRLAKRHKVRLQPGATFRHKGDRVVACCAAGIILLDNGVGSRFGLLTCMGNIDLRKLEAVECGFEGWDVYKDRPHTSGLTKTEQSRYYAVGKRLFKAAEQLA